MAKKHPKSLFVFRRDYRLEDNTGLIQACAESESVIPVFCFDPAQYDENLNDYFGKNSFRFLIESLEDLDYQLDKVNSKLHFLQGKPWEEITKLAVQEDCQAVYFNRDYTPYALERDSNIKAVLEKKEIELVTTADLLLNEPGSVCTGDGSTYKVFTPFKNKARETEVEKPKKFEADNLIKARSEILADRSILAELKPDGGSARQIGGRVAGLERLSVIKSFGDYSDTRNFPARDGTTEVSAHLKFGTLSIREVYHQALKHLGPGTQLITELYWRDFYAHVLYEWPQVLGDEFKEKYQGMSWPGVEQSEVDVPNESYVLKDELFEAWQQGRTGFPIVDAGMRQLLQDGWMHNRVRMIVASFLTKDLHLDWRWGEKHFANHLVGYDVASNNGGWQWASSTGTDAQPYFRIFNPWSQQKKFDPKAEFIKKYIPELVDVEAKQLHKLSQLEADDLKELLADIDYPKPIVDHSVERQVALEHYKNLG